MDSFTLQTFQLYLSFKVINELNIKDSYEDIDHH